MNAKIEEPGVLTPRFKNHGERMILGYRMLDNYMVRVGGVLMWRKAMRGHLRCCAEKETVAVDTAPRTGRTSNCGQKTVLITAPRPSSRKRGK